jgi:hypothetical protein
MNPLTEIKNRQAQKRAELEALNFTFSPAISFDGISIGEMEDLAALQIGESTFAGASGEECDVTRIA